MSLLRLDVSAASTLPVFNTITAVEGVEYVWRYQWSSRETAWYLTLKDQSGTVLAGSIKLVVAPAAPPPVGEYYGLLKKHQASASVPPGRLYAVDLSGRGIDIAAQGDLGTRVSLLYLTSDDPANF